MSDDKDKSETKKFKTRPLSDSEKQKILTVPKKENFQT